MKSGVAIWRCLHCRQAFFPQRLLCSRCHNADFAADRVYYAVVEEMSVIHQMIGKADWKPRRIANVRLAEGQRLTIGLAGNGGPGTVVELFEDEGVPFGAEKKWM